MCSQKTESQDIALLFFIHFSPISGERRPVTCSGPIASRGFDLLWTQANTKARRAVNLGGRPKLPERLAGIPVLFFAFAAAPNRQARMCGLRSETTRSWSYTGFMVRLVIQCFYPATCTGIDATKMRGFRSCAQRTGQIVKNSMCLKTHDSQGFKRKILVFSNVYALEKTRIWL